MSTTDTPEREYYTLREASLAFGLSVGTFRAMAKDGEVESSVVRGKYLLPVQPLRAYFQQRRHNPEGAAA